MKLYLYGSLVVEGFRAEGERLIVASRWRPGFIEAHLGA